MQGRIDAVEKQLPKLRISSGPDHAAYACGRCANGGRDCARRGWSASPPVRIAGLSPRWRSGSKVPWPRRRRSGRPRRSPQSASPPPCRPRGRPFEQRLGGVQFQRKIADRLDRVRVLPGVIETAVDPGTRLCANESDRFIDRRLGDAGVDGCLNDLENGAVGGGMIIPFVSRHEVRLRHLHIFQDHCFARSPALPKLDQLLITEVPARCDRRWRTRRGPRHRARRLERGGRAARRSNRSSGRSRITWSPASVNLVSKSAARLLPNSEKALPKRVPLQNLRDKKLLLRGDPKPCG